MNYYSNLLFDEPSCLEGIARILDFSNGLGTYNTSDSPEEADFKAILSDYYAIGQDVKDSMKEFRKPVLGCGIVVDGKAAYFEPWLLKSR